MSGKIILIIGPMYSGKSSALLRYFNRSLIANKRSILIKHSNDDRYDKNYVCTHDNKKARVGLSCNNLMKEALEVIDNYDNFFIDEGQFYDANIRQFCDIVANKGKNVYISALNGDYCCEIFPNISKLIPIANKIVKLTAICMECRDNSASYTHLKVENKNSKNRIIVGGMEKYVSLCRMCYNKLNSLNS